MPCPPPMHIVTSACLPPVRRSSYRALTARMAPVAPIGCPSEMPLPFGLVRSPGRPSSLATASAYFIWNAGWQRFLYCILEFGIRYYSTNWSNNLSVYMTGLWPLGGHWYTMLRKLAVFPRWLTGGI